MVYPPPGFLGSILVYPPPGFLGSITAPTLIAARTGRPSGAVRLPLADRMKRAFPVDLAGVDFGSDPTALAGFAGFDSEE